MARSSFTALLEVAISVCKMMPVAAGSTIERAVGGKSNEGSHAVLLFIGCCSASIGAACMTGR